MDGFKRAKGMLREGKYTLVMVMRSGVFTSAERGIKPLLEILNADMDAANACVADKVVGKAAAFLYTLMGVAKLYAYTVSEPALAVLKKAGIEVEYDRLVDGIRNRSDTGPCPMESAVWEATDAQVAREILEKKVKEMSL